MAHWNTLNKIVQITLAIQAVGLVVLVAYMMLRPTGGDPAQPFQVLQQFVQKYGPAKAVSYTHLTLPTTPYV